MPDSTPAVQAERAWIAIALAWIAGAVDVIGYLSLYKLFTAHMSGNTISMSAYAGSDWAKALHNALPIPVFILGILLGATLSELCIRAGMRNAFSLLLGLESLLLVVYLFFGKRILLESQADSSLAWFWFLVALPGGAMGIQNAAFRRAGRLKIRTTYISGMLTIFSDAAVAYGFWRHDRKRNDAGAEEGREYLHIMLLCGGIWLAYAVGGVMGGFSQRLWSFKSMFVPLCGLVFVIIADFRNPIFGPHHPGPRPSTRIP